MIALLILTTFLACVLTHTANAFCTTIPTGSVGLERTRGILNPVLRGPGLNCYNPIWTTLYIVDTTSQIDKVFSITCIASDRQPVFFSEISVTNKLEEVYVYDVYRTYEKPGIHYDDTTIKEQITKQIKWH